MKKSFGLLGIAASAAFLFTGCTKDICTQEVTYWKDVPIYKTADQVRVPITAEAARELKNPGKIYLYGSYVLINEIREGVHVIDNGNPSDPKNIAFIPIPGNVDIAMKGNVLYADNYMDLVAVDITTPSQAHLLKRVESIFPTFGTNPDNDSELLVAYAQELVTEKLSCDALNNQWGGNVILPVDVATSATQGNSSAGGASGAGRVSGMGGSMSRFAISGDYLYAVDNQDMHVISIVTMENPVQVNQVGMTVGTETLFPYEDKLFVGSNTGMLIYDCSDPTNPQYLSRFDHAFACDPVFVDGDFAYITLRDGSPCRQGANQLDIVDISTITSPTWVNSYAMETPYGLSVRDNNLYLCEGENGMKTFDVTDKSGFDLPAIGELPLHAYDVIAIPHTDRLMIVGNDGFYQYDAINASNPQLLSKIDVNK